MALSQETTSALYGAYRLARADAGGMAYFDTSVEGFWRSFFAAVLVAPLFGLFLAIRFNTGGLEVSGLRFAAVEIIAYVTAWVVFPLIMFHICQAIEREKQFIGYIVAYNWASVWQNLIYLPFVMLSELGYLSPASGRALGLAVLLLVLLYTWFITKTALRVTGILATGLVVLDFVVSIFLNTLTEGMLR
ncbi:MAG: hypothetical protein QGH73_07145 [Rhodospirillales bacterium]|jgi:hypothetical protein|nr:hypothetical protein [Rhodospirillaceae bacterium]MDP6426701.1 hypothetical protein [Rhodospirillales bacterium]MDP6642494.1 hypothetical protein [Rhodospirillales bacterium]MDP6841436.1 hypothetical protein [Rhodospirillales bacterium]|tara:strand:+ start:438 stop:1007 length:570 start_codon:yes stop_codon:yes gene_type:complete